MSREIARIIEGMEDRHERIERRLIITLLGGSLAFNVVLMAACLISGVFLP